MLSPTPLPRCRRRTGFACASISTTNAAPPNWPTMAGHSTHRPRRRPISPRRSRSARQAVSGSTCCATWRTGSNTAGKVARTGYGSKPPAAKSLTLSQEDNCRARGLAGSTPSHPSTAPPEQVRGRPQDEDTFSMPSTISLILSSAAAEPRRVSKDATTSCSASTISARRAASVSDSSAIDQRQAGDVVGLFGAGGKFGGGSDDFLDELGGADAPLAIEDRFEPRFAKNVSGRVERLGDAVGEHEQRVAGSEHGFGDGVRAVGVDAKRDAGRFQQVAAAAGAQQIGRVVAGIAVA